MSAVGPDPESVICYLVTLPHRSRCIKRDHTHSQDASTSPLGSCVLGRRRRRLENEREKRALAAGAWRVAGLEGRRRRNLDGRQEVAH